MKFFADLHIHSSYSRATSKELTLENLWAWGQRKGITVIGTGDCLHPQWLEDITTKLIPAEEGLYALKDDLKKDAERLVPASCKSEIRFVLSVEISSIYKRGGEVRKVHNLICLPSIESAQKFQTKLSGIGNIKSDGRPILGLDSQDLLKIVMDIDDRSLFIPAHIWTPWFSVLGSKSGFDSIEECFGDLTKHIHALETGLSSDPPMNWRLEKLDPFVLVSNSDAHSPSKLGREATIFDSELSYEGMRKALVDKDDKGLVGTVEFFPEEGKYHLDGHRKCETRMEPKDTIKNDGKCPVCGKPVTVGVMSRVEELSSRPAGEKPARGRPYNNCIPLPEIIAEVEQCGVGTNRVDDIYQKMLDTLGNEFGILLDVPIEKIESVNGRLIGDAIRKMRAGTIHIAAGYDGEFGTIDIFSPEERKKLSSQVSILLGGISIKDNKEIIDENKAEIADDSTRKSQKRKQSKPVSIESVMIQEESPDYSSTPNSLSPLNESQQRAVDHDEGHLLIVAGPGTGKTHTLTHRIASAVSSLSSSQKILAITFTNKAAQEMHERLETLLDGNLDRVVAGTFHRFCLDLIRQYNSESGVPKEFTIAGTDEQSQAGHMAWPELTEAKRRRQLDDVSKWKSCDIASDKPALISEYDSIMRQHGWLDFDDLLREAWMLLKSNQKVKQQIHKMYRQVFVDEYQDINPVQHALLKELIGDGILITAIGDPNQAIYGFRGADSRYFSSFQNDFTNAKVLYLTENYRSTSQILSASSQVIIKNANAAVPAIIPRLHAEGRLIIHEAVSDKAEAEYVVHQIEKLVGGTAMFSHDSDRVESHADSQYTFGDIAVLFRMKAQEAALQEAFERSGIPCQYISTRALGDVPLVRDTIDFLTLASGRGLAPTIAIRTLETVCGEFGMEASAALLELWQGKKLVKAADVERLPSTKAPQLRGHGAQFQRFVGDLDRVMISMKIKRLAGVLDQIAQLPAWRNKLTSDEAREIWRRLTDIAGSGRDVRSCIDNILLVQPADSYDIKAEKISIMTLHASKGLEFPVVFIVGCEDGLIPLKISGLESDGAEERRLFYVGMTRAKRQLYLVRARKRMVFGQVSESSVSPFIVDIEEKLKEYEKQSPEKKKAKKVEAEQLSLFE